VCSTFRAGSARSGAPIAESADSGNLGGNNIEPT
jgi:hypothetical protein